jgi:nucleotide-binding universal stress UspA family protein
MERHDHTTQAPIVAAYSPDTCAREPVEFGIAASRITGAPLVIVAVTDTGSMRAHFGEEGAPPMPEPLRHLENELKARGLYVEIRTFNDSTPARGLARAIDELEPELVVIGSTHRGTKGSALLGTTAERVLHVSACPVAVIPNGYQRPEGGVATIGAAYTPTEEGEDALRAAAGLARAGGVRLRAITVLDPRHAAESTHRMGAEQHHELGPEVDKAAKGRLHTETRLNEALAQLGAEAEIDVLVNAPVAGLIAASEHVDILVMGSRGLGPRRSVVLGSVSRRVIDRAACPVLVIPRGAVTTADELVSDVAATQPPR